MTRIRKLRQVSLLGSVVFTVLGAALEARGVELVVNGDFEADTEGFVAWPGYVTNGGNPPEIPDWFGTGGGRGINPINDPNETRDLAPFNNGDNDTHFLLMQGATTIGQDIEGFEVGREYALTLEYNARNCCGDFPQVEMTFDGDFVDDFPDPDLFLDGIVEPSNGPWWVFEMSFTADAETMTLEVASQPSAGGDATFIMDNISVMPLTVGPIPLAGDADLDRDFDQLDLVKVQIAGKYLTGQPATWGDGDWDGAPDPDSSFESPPQGDGVFNQLDIISALGASTYLTGPYAAIRPGGQAGDDQTSIGYDAGTGEVWVDAPSGVELTSVNIDSAAGIFTGDPAQNLGGSFDNDADDNIFKATFGGSFGSTSFGNVAQSGLSEEFLLNDLTTVGSRAGGGDLGDVDLIYIPEPSALMLVMWGMAIWTIHRARKP